MLFLVAAPVVSVNAEEMENIQVMDSEELEYGVKLGDWMYRVLEYGT